MNIFTKAKNGTMTPEVGFVAGKEGLDAARVMEGFAGGEIAIFKNSARKIDPVGVGRGLSTKINANIGTSPDMFDATLELEKLRVSVEAGADTIMDLSTGGDLPAIRRQIIGNCGVPLGTVPLYEVAVEMKNRKKSVIDMEIEDFLGVIRKQCEDGVDFMTIHSGITRESLASLKSGNRVIGITSRGGSIIAEWISVNKKENPLYEHYDEILDILAPYNVVVSLGDGLRPGAIADAGDRGQIHEMIILGSLARRAREKGVQAIIEGPGHMPLDMIADNMRLEKSICDGAPYYVLGPLVTDVAPGYDHITSAIGGAIAAASGADFLCYVTPAEHLRLPTVEDVREGVIASKIAAHAGDIVKLGSRASGWDRDMSKARKERNWEKMFSHSIDQKRAREYRGASPSQQEDQCSMCGEFCAIKRQY
ncbi:MAG: phosphomethylpyrimidine synthase ThiC [Spirochaetes bacterium]|jgi:phosphomethylpyrimidine synthase|nr:phosphomethylpyrimidine synthase ThiC [Spirochaetota bacterium]